TARRSISTGRSGTRSRTRPAVFASRRRFRNDGGCQVNAGVLTVGAELPGYRASARMPADPVENKIHGHELAKAMGFRGGRGPGGSVYSWMAHPVVEALGTAWLERGTFSVRFAKPVYFDEEVTVTSIVAERTGGAVTLQTRVIDTKGETCGTATMTLPAGPV